MPCLEIEPVHRRTDSLWQLGACRAVAGCSWVRCERWGKRTVWWFAFQHDSGVNCRL